MILKTTIITLCLTASCFVSAMNKEIIPTTKQPKAKKNLSFAEKRYKEIDDEFEKKWGYPIPSMVVEETIGTHVRYKAVPANYISPDPSAKIRFLTDEDLVSPTTNVTSPRVETILTRETVLAASLKREKELLNKRLIELTELEAKKRSENEQLREKINHIKQKTEEAKAQIAKSQIKPTANNTNTPNNQNTTKKRHQRNKQKKQPAVVEAPKTTPTTETQQTSIAQTDANQDLQKKNAILETLFEWHKVKSEGELKTKFAKECRQEKSNGRIGGLQNGTWEYSLKTDQLIISTYDCQ